ncbi:FAD:protein FMN transferase [Paenibacillus sp. BSR1-1]|uniref:FAD:protein FMN transferase n=1 Tax=Paenibacillus sp. BSR1-1 TaxID=3020845 RepID=UPI0025AF15EA|nr:FAD:protein FMN transferase [Paenibacillus sp. BSR1-1]MDN3018165.1 FAD:protein FMN transferase [Paenibacillus sp. BSR1-1]
MYKYQFNSMSTIVKISVSRELFANDLMQVYKLFEDVEDTCSRFKEDSELSLLNQQLEKEAVISADMFSILTMAESFYKETDGIFNPGVLTALESIGYSKSIESIRGQKLEIASPSTIAAINPFTLNENLQSVILHTKIDLGGIAKGWVIDKASKLLENMGFGFINVGGDIRIFGSLQRQLNIGIENPFENTKIISSIQVKDGALATSTSMKRKWNLNGKQAHHLIDSRTGKPSESRIVSATVTAPTALEADVWAKTALLLGEEKGKEWLIKKGCLAVLINKDGEIWEGGVQNGNV